MPLQTLFLWYMHAYTMAHIFHTHFPSMSLLTWSFKDVQKYYSMDSSVELLCLNRQAAFLFHEVKAVYRRVHNELHQPSSAICTSFEHGNKIHCAYLWQGTPKSLTHQTFERGMKLFSSLPTPPALGVWNVERSRRKFPSTHIHTPPRAWMKKSKLPQHIYMTTGHIV